MADPRLKNTVILTRHIQGLPVLSKSYEYAINIANDPYYEKIDETNHNIIIFGQTKISASVFCICITLSVRTENTQLTLAVYPVQKGTPRPEYVKNCLHPHPLYFEITMPKS